MDEDDSTDESTTTSTDKKRGRPKKSGTTMLEYREDLAASKNLDPLAPPQFTDFDFDQLSRDLGEANADLGRDDVIEAGAAVFRAILAWVVRGRQTRDMLHTIGLRCVLAAWALDPTLLTEEPSLAQLARQLGCGPSYLAPFTAHFSRTFGVTNRFQAHASERVSRTFGVTNRFLSRGQAHDLGKRIAYLKSEQKKLVSVLPAERGNDEQKPA